MFEALLFSLLIQAKPKQPPQKPMGSTEQFHSVDEVRQALREQEARQAKQKLARPRLAGGIVPKPGEPFILQADYNGPTAPEYSTNYRLVQNGIVVQGISGYRTLVEFAHTGLPVGQYTFIVRAQNVYPPENDCWKLNPANECDKTTDSLPLDVLISTTQVPPSVSAVPTPAKPGENQVISWACTTGCGTIGRDWIGLFAKGSNQDIWWPGVYLATPGSGTLNNNAPAPGDYEYRYCLDDGYNCPASFPFQVISQPTVQPPTVVKTILRCSFTLDGVPPDSTTGWRAQFQQNGINIGNQDNNEPYQRTTQLPGGVYNFTIIWTKSGVPAITTPSTQQACQ